MAHLMKGRSAKGIQKDILTDDNGALIVSGGGGGSVSTTDLANGAATAPSSAPANGSQLAVLNSIASNTSGISAASIISVQTANPGTGWVTFQSTVGDTIDIQNFTGTDIEYRRGGAGSAIRIPDGFGREIDIVANANEIQVRRVDQTNTQVTVVAEVTA